MTDLNKLFDSLKNLEDTTLSDYMDDEKSSDKSKQCEVCEKWAINQRSLENHATKHINEVLPGLLYISSEKSAKDVQDLVRNRINVVVNAAVESKNQLAHHNLGLIDYVGQDIRKAITVVNKIVDDAEKEKSKVLVHCVMGISRSAALCIAYMMYHEMMTFKDALAFLKSKRCIVEPNKGFREQLLAYEKELDEEYKKGLME